MVFIGPRSGVGPGDCNYISDRPEGVNATDRFGSRGFGGFVPGYRSRGAFGRVGDRGLVDSIGSTSVDD